MKASYGKKGGNPKRGKKKDHAAVAKESNAALYRRISVLELALDISCNSMAYNPASHYIEKAKAAISQKLVIGNPQQATRR